VRSKIVEHDLATFGVGIVDGEPFLRAVREVERDAPLDDLDMTPGVMGIEVHEQVGGAVSAILMN